MKRRPSSRPRPARRPAAKGRVPARIAPWIDPARRLDLLNRFANDIVLLHDTEGLILEVNDRAVEAYGLPRHRLVGMSAADLLAPEALGSFAALLARISAAEGTLVESLHRRADGSVFPVELSVRPFRAGGRTYYQAFIRDITERKRLHERLLVAERLAAGSTLAARVAHEINSPLSAAIANVEFVLREAASQMSREAAEALRDGRDALERTGRILRELLAIAGRDA